AQEVYIAIHQGIARFDGGWRDFRSWIWRIAWAKSAEYWQRRFGGRRKLLHVDVPSIAVDSQGWLEIKNEETARAVLRLSFHLSAQQGRLFRLHAQGMPTEQIASKLGISLIGPRLTEAQSVLGEWILAGKLTGAQGNYVGFVEQALENDPAGVQGVFKRLPL